MQTSDLIEFRNSGIHGMGGFALVDIKEGAKVIEYVGRLIDKEESLRQCELDNPFIFTINVTHDLDGNVDWNPARFLNHSCAPNCEAQDEEGRIWIVASRDIKQGEEITFNYNYDLEDYKEHPCCCGAPKCVGYIVAEEFFPDLEKKKALSESLGASESSQ
ncbi:SET domain-containing protein [Pedosphaera parvula]|uniref:Nuclear protein SET n=1 Tax=Pedosphaera parvula (strain Ellin514) TaxID=320771 RepID=B9XC78_PEDPL|nr:SET domain-containing protein-lysine N-methyltransferase [Pedosphaera parvula]EEF62546.1 nuclear protein SET [Pedosphaera parvula Ellin514]